MTSHQDLLKILNNKPEFLNKIGKGDEFWCFAYNPEKQMKILIPKCTGSKRRNSEIIAESGEVGD